MFASALGNTDVVSILLRHGADTNARLPNGCSALHHAVAFSQNEEIVAILLDHGADPNSTIIRDTPLVMATRNRNAVIQSLLLEHGAKATPGVFFFRPCLLGQECRPELCGRRQPGLYQLHKNMFGLCSAHCSLRMNVQRTA